MLDAVEKPLVRPEWKFLIPSRVGHGLHLGYSLGIIIARMSTLTEIEQAADRLSPEEKEELFLFLATRLRASEADLPPPREFSREQMDRWIAEDEEGHRRFRDGK